LTLVIQFLPPHHITLLFPYTTLFRSEIPGASVLLSALQDAPHAIVTSADVALMTARMGAAGLTVPALAITAESVSASKPDPEGRSEEHTSELQSRENIVCRPLLEQKK